MKAKYCVVFCFIACFILLLASCASKPEKAIIGKWVMEESVVEFFSIIEFFEDGTARVSERGKSEFRNYVFIDKNRIRLDLPGGLSQRSLLVNLQVSKNKLLLTFPGGVVEYLRPVENKAIIGEWVLVEEETVIDEIIAKTVIETFIAEGGEAIDENMIGTIIAEVERKAIINFDFLKDGTVRLSRRRGSKWIGNYAFIGKNWMRLDLPSDLSEKSFLVNLQVSKDKLSLTLDKDVLELLSAGYYTEEYLEDRNLKDGDAVGLLRVEYLREKVTARVKYLEETGKLSKLILDEAKPRRAAIDIEQLGLGLDMYAADNGQYPTTEQGLDALIRKPTLPPEPENWAEAYVEETKFLDPWGARYIYESPSKHEGYDYDLYSYGADGMEGGGDDITNWLY